LVGTHPEMTFTIYNAGSDEADLCNVWWSPSDSDLSRGNQFLVHSPNFWLLPGRYQMFRLLSSSTWTAANTTYAGAVQVICDNARSKISHPEVRVGTRP
jgi:hypothetical protein